MILVTGASGFLGKKIVDRARPLGVNTLGRTNCDIEIDLSQNIPHFQTNYSLVVHCAGKAHFVPRSAAEEEVFYKVNVEGTRNLLSGLEKIVLPENLVFISSVSVYGVETGELITEDAPLAASNAYGKSKIEAEKIVQDWGDKNNVTITIIRLPLVVGDNPPGNLKSMIMGIEKGYYFNVSGGRAKKSMVLADDIAKLVLVNKKGGTYNLTDGCHPSFYELSSLIAVQLKKSRPINIPKFFVFFIALVGDLLPKKIPINSKKLNQMTSDLTFDDSKARRLLGWKPKKVLEEFRVV